MTEGRKGDGRKTEGRVGRKEVYDLYFSNTSVTSACNETTIKILAFNSYYIVSTYLVNIFGKNSRDNLKDTKLYFQYILKTHIYMSSKKMSRDYPFP